MEKKFSEQDSLELIAQMIQSTKESNKIGQGKHFLINGYFAIALSVAIYLLSIFTNSSIWNAAWFLMFTPMIIFKIIESKSSVVTYIEKVVSEIWQIISFLFIITVVVLLIMNIGFKVPSFVLMFPLTLLYCSIGVSITGAIVKEKSLKYAPIVSFIIALYMLMVFLSGEPASAIWNIYFGISFLVMMVIPGHILNIKSRRNV